MPENGTYGSIGGRWGCRNLWRDGTRTRRGNPAGLSRSRPTGDAEPAAYLTVWRRIEPSSRQRRAPSLVVLARVEVQPAGRSGFR